MYMIITSLIISLLAYNSNYIICLLVNIVYCEEVCIENSKNLFYMLRLFVYQNVRVIFFICV